MASQRLYERYDQARVGDQARVVNGERQGNSTFDEAGLTTCGEVEHERSEDD